MSVIFQEKVLKLPNVLLSTAEDSPAPTSFLINPFVLLHNSQTLGQRNAVYGTSGQKHLVELLG